MTLSPLLLAVLLKGAVVLALASLAAWALRRAPSSIRHGVWAAAFGALLLLPLLEAVGPSWSVPMLPAPAPSLAIAPVAPPAPPAPPPPPPPVPPAPPPPPEAVAGLIVHQAETDLFHEDIRAFEANMAAFDADVERFEAEMEAFEAGHEVLAWAPSPALVYPQHELRGLPSSLGTWLLGIWAFGAALVALGWVTALLSAHRLVRTAQPETDEEWGVLAERARRLAGVSGPVRLLRSDALEVPIAWGLGRPAVVLPAPADEWREDRREAVLLHEMAHLRRRDAWTQLAAQAALALHWANPLAWWAYRGFLDAREQACDDAVLQGGARPSDYAEHLVCVARALQHDRFALSAVAPMARRAPLEGRILSILDPHRQRRRLTRPALGGTVGLALLVIAPLAAFRPVPHAQEASVVAFADVEPVIEGPVIALPEVVVDTTDDWRAVEAAATQARQRAAVAPVEPALAPHAPHEDSWEFGPDADEWELRAHALQEAERALAEIDIDAIVAEALTNVEHVNAEAEWHVEVEAALREARVEIEQARADIQRAQAEARAEVRAAQAEVRAEAHRARARSGAETPIPPPPPVPPAPPTGDGSPA